MIIEKPDITSWKNSDNIDFYNSIPRNWLPKLTQKLGIDTGCDIELIMPYIKKAKSVLELGAGYGRVLQQLIIRGYKQKLTAVERCSKFCKILYKKYSNYADIFEMDIEFLDLDGRYDLILWLWSGFCDFSKKEQLNALSLVKRYLNREGLLIIDTLCPTSIPITAISSHQQHYVIPEGNSNLYVYIPSILEMKNYAETLGFSNFNYFNYITLKKSRRIIYIFRN